MSSMFIFECSGSQMFFEILFGFFLQKYISKTGLFIVFILVVCVCVCGGGGGVSGVAR